VIRIPSALALAVCLLGLPACSTGGSTAASHPAVPPSAVTTATPAPGVTSSPDSATTGHTAKAAPPRSADSPQQQITALSTAGGVPSLVVQLPAAGHVPTVRAVDLAIGQTLRVIVVSPVATHLTGQGIGVDIDVPAGSPTAMDVVAFSAGTYVLTMRGGGVVLKATVRG
jgi:hypothetical protein